MSGHSKWSTIKHKKAATDAARGKLFSKLSKAITVAAKTGGGNDPDTNYKLRIAVDAAKAQNMPKSNIDRVLSKAGEAGDLIEAVYEGFGPGNIGVIVEVATDNKNRSAQEVKSIFDKGGGNFVNPGAVSFNFDQKGLIIVRHNEMDSDEAMLSIMDMEVDEIDEAGNEIEVYTDPKKLSEVKSTLEGEGFDIVNASLTMKPKTMQEITDAKTADKCIKLLETLEDHDDVQNVFTNMDIDESLDL